MNDSIPQTETMPPAPREISISKKVVKVIAATVVVMLAIAGTTLGTITIVQLTHTRHQLAQTQQSLSQTQGQLSAAQSQISCMLPTIDYLSQFGGWFQQNSTDAFGNVTGKWYMPAANSGQPAGGGSMGSCSN